MLFGVLSVQLQTKCRKSADGLRLCLGKIQFTVLASLNLTERHLHSMFIFWGVWLHRFIGIFSWRVKSCKWGGVMLSRLNSTYLIPQIWCSSAFSSSPCFWVVFMTQSLVIWVFWAGHGHIFVFACHFRDLADMCLYRIFQYKCKRHKSAQIIYCHCFKECHFEGKKTPDKSVIN